MHKLRCWTRVSALPQDGIQIARNSKSFRHLLRESNSGVERSLVFLSIDDRDRAARALEGVSGTTLLAVTAVSDKAGRVLGVSSF
jgi:hypothetical protein